MAVAERNPIQCKLNYQVDPAKRPFNFSRATSRSQNRDRTRTNPAPTQTW